MQWVSGRSRRALLAWGLLAAASLLVVVTSAGAQEGAGEPTAQQGSALYAQHCARCHGSEGQGGTLPDGAPVPPLAGEEGVSLAYFDLVLRTGRMPPPENDPFDNQERTDIFDAEEREALLAFGQEALGVEGEIPAVEEGDPGQGQQVYARQCAACHGATGSGGVAGAGAWTPAVTQYEAVAIAEAVRVGPFEMPAFAEEQISDEEVADIAAFVEEVAEEEGTVLGLVELNPVFLSGFTAFLAVLTLLAVVFISGRPAWFPDPEAAQEEQAEASGEEHEQA